MGLRELKETANQQFVRGKFAQSAQTYHQILRLVPKDPNMWVRHAEACRRAGERLHAIASYRAAAELLLEIGCESRARGALKAALELDPRDPLLQAEIARLGPHHEEPFFGSASAQDELPLLPPLESGQHPLPASPPPAPRQVRVLNPEMLMRTLALPKIHRALPSAPSVPPLTPPVLLPAPRVPSSASGTTAPATSRAATPPPRSATTGHPAPRPVSAPLPPRSATAGHPAPATQPVMPPKLQPRSATSGVPAPGAAPAPSPRASSQASNGASVPPPPPTEALRENNLGAALARTAAGSVSAEPSQEARPRLEVRRLSANALAFRSSPHDSWALIRSHAPLEMHLVDDLEKLPPLLRDLTPEITVERQAESAVH